jgi:hypothetical protein
MQAKVASGVRLQEPSLYCGGRIFLIYQRLLIVVPEERVSVFCRTRAGLGQITNKTAKGCSNYGL